MFRNRTAHSFLFLLLCIFALSSVAHASTVSFNFNSIPLTPATCPTVGTGYCNASDSQVQTTLRSQLPTGALVTVTGALATNDYIADGNVVGATNAAEQANTLAGSSTSPNTYLINDNGQEVGTNSFQDILMSFSGLTITSITFTLEIFPDNSCTQTNGLTGTPGCGGTGNPNVPDFEFYSAVNSTGSAVTKAQDVSGTNVTWTQASASPWSANICKTGTFGTTSCTDPQRAPLTVTISLPTGTNTLDFQDWPATIGISNLSMTVNTPEPSSLLLLGVGLTGLLTIRRRRAAK